MERVPLPPDPEPRALRAADGRHRNTRTAGIRAPPVPAPARAAPAPRRRSDAARGGDLGLRVGLEVRRQLRRAERSQHPVQHRSQVRVAQLRLRRAGHADQVFAPGRQAREVADRIAEVRYAVARAAAPVHPMAAGALQHARRARARRWRPGPATRPPARQQGERQDRRVPARPPTKRLVPFMVWAWPGPRSPTWCSGRWTTRSTCTSSRRCAGTSDSPAARARPPRIRTCRRRSCRSSRCS